MVWIHRSGPAERARSLVIAYLEGDVAVDLQQQGTRARLADKSWLGRLETAAGVQVHVGEVTGRPQLPPAVYQRAVAERDRETAALVQPAQFTQPIPAPPQGPPVPPGARRIRVFSRSEVRAQAQWFPDRATNQWIAVIDSGVNLIVENLPLSGGAGPVPGLELPSLISIDVSADRIVIWTVGLEELDLGGNKLQADNIPLEVYMEGNIVFRQGDREIQADRMYYDVNNQVGTILNAELLTPVSKYEGLLRLKAEVLRQTGRDRFFAQSAFVTSSRLGFPSYRLQVGSAYIEDIQQPRVDPVTGLPVLNPETHEPEIEHHRLATTENNVLFLDELPVFYWPRLASDLEESSYYLRRVRFKTDNIFGVQAMTDWDMYQLLGIRSRPEGTDWGLSLDYLSERGFGHGTDFKYRREGFLGIPGKAAGLIDYWGVPDHGVDNLGLDRRSVPPDRDYRFRLLARHEQMLEGDIQLKAELGWISDRNFLEQYYEREWDELKDQTTSLELKRIRDNTAWSLSAAVRVNDFFTQTDWLPRADHFWLGQPVLNDVLTWYEHSSVGYAQLHAADPPSNPGELAKWRRLPWERSPAGTGLNTQSERFVTRQELDWPFQLGPVKLVPYVLGEAAHWGEAIDGNDLQRLYGQAGLRASIPAWRADPAVESAFWNVHGLAHKAVFDAELAWADANRNVDELPLYDPLDDDSVEAFRRRFIPNTFPGPNVPLRFDERFYAVRTGMAGWVTAPSTEIAEDLMFLRLGMRNRWQTKRGPPDQPRIVDWITLDTNLTFFPKDERDNFGELVGLFDYDARWQVGDRLALLSSGIFDFFQDGQRIVTVGAFLERPPRGGLYLGVRLLDGPINNTILAMSYSYRMSPKWVSAFGMTIDLRDQGNIGQHLSITRVGESLLVSAGFNVDASRGSFGAALSIEPRFLPKTRLGRAGGARIPPAGAYGLE